MGQVDPVCCSSSNWESCYKVLVGELFHLYNCRFWRLQMARPFRRCRACSGSTCRQHTKCMVPSGKFDCRFLGNLPESVDDMRRARTASSRCDESGEACRGRGDEASKSDVYSPFRSPHSPLLNASQMAELAAWQAQLTRCEHGCSQLSKRV